MQSNSSRPVMDVARRPSTSSPRSSVRPAPVVSRAVQTPTIPKVKPTPESPTTDSDAPKENTNSPKKAIPATAKSTMPVGIIVMSLLVMMVLIGLAVVIYLTS